MTSFEKLGYFFIFFLALRQLKNEMFVVFLKNLDLIFWELCILYCTLNSQIRIKNE
jgi:hypothetical protein